MILQLNELLKIAAKPPPQPVCLGLLSEAVPQFCGTASEKGIRSPSQIQVSVRNSISNSLALKNSCSINVLFERDPVLGKLL